MKLPSEIESDRKSIHRFLKKYGVVEARLRFDNGRILDYQATFPKVRKHVFGNKRVQVKN